MIDLRALRLQLLFTPSMCRRDPWFVLREAVAGGVDLVQWRVKTGDPDAADRNHDRLRQCIGICRELSVPVLVNDDVRAAVESGADGAHVGQDDMPGSEARRLLGPDLCLGISTHSTDEIAGAVAAGADCLGFGPLFPTTTKGYRHQQPVGALRDALGSTALPVFGIGGLDPERVATLRRREWLDRIAVSSAILGSDDPRGVAAALLEALGTA